MGAEAGGGEIFNQLLAAYAESHRRYHDMDHVSHCLALFDQVREHLHDPDAMEMAIWFHDYVYKTASSRNEKQSARRATEALRAAGVAETTIRKVAALIVATKHDRLAKDDSEDAAYLADIDLAILGAPAREYEAYEKNIRAEYRWVPPLLYHRKRHAILSAFIKRPFLFQTAFFRRKFEAQARENIARVLAGKCRLSAGLI